MTTSVQDLTPRLYYLDLEVDRVTVDKGEPRPCITQICVMDPSRPDHKFFNAYIKPPKELRKKALEMSFEPGHVEAPRYSFKRVWPKLKEWVNQPLDGHRQAVFVAHNGYEHDWPILQTECARVMDAIPKYWKPFCSLYLSKALDMQGDHSLTGLCHKYQVEVLQAHDAYNDVKMLSNLFREMVGEVNFKSLCKAMVDPDHPVRKVAALIKNPASSTSSSSSPSSTISKTHQIATLVFIDFETTGLFPRKGESGPNPRATEFAAYIPSREASFSSLIDPGIPIPEIVVNITGITDELVQGQPSFKAVWLDFEKWLDTTLGAAAKKVILVGHNIWGYDLKVYESECERTGVQKRRWKSMDTCILSRHLFKGTKPQPEGLHKLQTLRKRMGIAENDAHRALGDVIVTAAVFKRFVEGVDPIKLDAALMSAHPILATGQLVRDTGSFDPHSLLAAPKPAEAPPASPSSPKVLPLPGKRSRRFFEKKGKSDKPQPMKIESSEEEAAPRRKSLKKRSKPALVVVSSGDEGDGRDSPSAH